MSGWSVTVVSAGSDEARFAVRVPEEPMTREEARALAAYLADMTGPGPQEIVR